MNCMTAGALPDTNAQIFHPRIPIATGTAGLAARIHRWYFADFISIPHSFIPVSYTHLSIHYSQLVPNPNQFYTEKELEDLADIIQILGGVAQNRLVRKKDAEQYEILAGHRRWRASQIVVQRGFPEYAYLPRCV